MDMSKVVLFGTKADDWNELRQLLYMMTGESDPLVAGKKLAARCTDLEMLVKKAKLE